MSGPAISRSPRHRTGSGRAGRRRERGVSWVSLLLLIVVVGAGYLVWVWGPLYVAHYEVKQVVSDYLNQAVKNTDDAALRQAMCQKLASLAQERTMGERGQLVVLPAIQVDERVVTWERDQGAKTLRIAFEYERQVVYPFLDRTAVKTFSVDKTGDLTPPDWGPTR